MEREIKTIKTPLEQHEIALYTYITGKEQREINSAVYDKAEVDIVDGQPVFRNFKTKDIVDGVQNRTIEVVIKSVDGSSENILETVLSFKSQDYEFVIQAVNETVYGVKKN
jgi:hypothetical protein